MRIIVGRTRVEILPRRRPAAVQAMIGVRTTPSNVTLAHPVLANARMLGCDVPIGEASTSAAYWANRAIVSIGERPCSLAK